MKSSQSDMVVKWRHKYLYMFKHRIMQIYRHFSRWNIAK